MRDLRSIRLRHRGFQGFSMVEMLVAMTIGLLLLAVLATIFSNTSRSQRELAAQSQQIENGRYVLDTLADELHHPGFFGYFVTPTATPPGGLPNPCAVDAATLQTGLALPLQGYNGGGGFT